MKNNFDLNWQYGKGRTGLYYAYYQNRNRTTNEITRDYQISKAKERCYQKLFNPNVFSQFKNYKINIEKKDIIKINTKSRLYEWNPNLELNTEENIYNINYYSIPIHIISKDLFDIIHHCLIESCQSIIGLGYIQSSLKNSKYVLIALAENQINIQDKIVLGFVYYKFVSSNYINDIEYDNNVKNDYIETTKKENIKYDSVEPKSIYIKKNEFYRELNISEDEYIDNKLYISLICSNFGAGGELLQILQSDSFYHFIKHEFNLIYLDSIESQYTYYTIKHDFLRTRDMIDIYPQYKDLYFKNVYRIFDKFNQDNDDKTSKALLLSILNKKMNKSVFPYEDLEGNYNLMKYIPRNQYQKDIYNNFLKSLEDSNITEQSGGVILNKIYIKYNQKIYLVKVDKNTQKKYIKSSNQKLYLESIRNKYRYVKN